MHKGCGRANTQTANLCILVTETTQEDGEDKKNARQAEPLTSITFSRCVGFARLPCSHRSKRVRGPITATPSIDCESFRSPIVSCCCGHGDNLFSLPSSFISCLRAHPPLFADLCVLCIFIFLFVCILLCVFARVYQLH